MVNIYLERNYFEFLSGVIQLKKLIAFFLVIFYPKQAVVEKGKGSNLRLHYLGREGVEVWIQSLKAGLVTEVFLEPLQDLVSTKTVPSCLIDGVDVNEYMDYHTLIKRPISFTKIAKGLESSFLYTSPEKLKADVDLLFINANTYFSKKEPSISRASQALQTKYEKVCIHRHDFFSTFCELIGPTWCIPLWDDTYTRMFFLNTTVLVNLSQ